MNETLQNVITMELDIWFQLYRAIVEHFYIQFDVFFSHGKTVHKTFKLSTSLHDV